MPYVTVLIQNFHHVVAKNYLYNNGTAICFSVNTLEYEILTRRCIPHLLP